MDIDFPNGFFNSEIVLKRALFLFEDIFIGLKTYDYITERLISQQTFEICHRKSCTGTIRNMSSASLSMTSNKTW